jgi:hypothetical protein
MIDEFKENQTFEKFSIANDIEFGFVVKINHTYLASNLKVLKELFSDLRFSNINIFLEYNPNGLVIEGPRQIHKPRFVYKS